MTSSRSGLDAADELVELQRQQAAVGAELHHVVGDLLGDPPDHLQALDDDGDVADGDEILDLEGRERARDLVEPGLVPLQRGERLVGLGEDGVGALEHVAQAADVERDDPHRLADGDHGVAGLLGDPFRRTVPGAGLARLDRRVGHELDGGAQDARHVLVGDDRAVHLGELAQPGGRELDVEHEAAGADLLDQAVLPEDDERTGAAPQDPLEPVSQLRARGDGRERGAQQIRRGAVVGHGTPCVGSRARTLVGRATGRVSAGRRNLPDIRIADDT